MADSFEFLQSAHDSVLSDLKLPPKDKGWFTFYFGKDREFIYMDIYGDLSEQAKLLFEAFVRKHHVEFVKPLKGAAEILDTLAAKNMTCGIVTNKVGDFVRKEVKAFGWDRHFKTTIGAGEAEQDKPSCAPLKLAVEHAGMQGKHIWYVGDSIADMHCANEYGCPFILVHPHSTQRPDFYDESMVDAVFADLSLFNDYLLQSL